MAKHHLTPKFVEHLSPSGTYRFAPDASGRIEIGDLKVQGLIFRVTRNGLKTWSFIYRPRTRKNGKWVAGPQQRITFGRFPSMGLKEAREVAMDYYEQVIAGEDPKDELREQERQTFEVVMAQFYEKSLVSRSKHPHLWMQRMRKHIPEEWLDRPIHEITRGDVHDLLDKVLETGPGAAREVRKQLHAMFVWAVDREIVSLNPLYRLNRPELKVKPDVRTPLDDKQIRELWNLDIYIAAQLRLLLLTGCRKVEIGRSKWSEYDLEERTFTIPKERHKGKRETVIPLSDPAVEILRSLPRMGEQVFRRGYLDSTRLLPAQRRLSFHLRPHDLRATVATRLGRLGTSPNVIQLCLGQALHGLVQVYDKHNYLDEKREAMERYGEHIKEIVG